MNFKKLIEFKEKYEDIETVKVDRDLAKIEIEELEKLIGNLTVEISSLAKENEALGNEINQINKKITLLENDKKELQLANVAPKVTEENEYEKNKELFKQSGKEISSDDE
jgi:uncharacterized coiled-coil DUF342 family protein